MTTLLIIAGLVGLVAASELAVAGSRELAERFERSHLTVGLTIAAVGTSLPEIATNVGAALVPGPGQGSGLAVGNIVGSCLSQITLLLGVTAMVHPLRVTRAELWRDGGAALGALALMTLVIADGVATRLEGLGLALVYGGYLGYVWRRGAGVSAEPGDPVAGPRRPALLPSLQAAAGIALLVFSADLLVDNAVKLAVELGVEETKLGLAVGVATGLPELAFAVSGARQGAVGLAVGNLLGSNITDPLASFGIGASLRAVEVSPAVLTVDVPVWAGSTVLTLALLARAGGLGRLSGAALALGFVAYSLLRGTS